MGVRSSWNFMAEKVKCCSLNALLLLSALPTSSGRLLIGPFTGVSLSPSAVAYWLDMTWWWRSKWKGFWPGSALSPGLQLSSCEMHLSLPSMRHMESLHVVQAQHLIDLLHFLQQCFYWCYCFNDLCFTFTRFCSSLGISFEIPSEIWIIHALLHLFLCLSVALLEITITVGCVIEGLEAGVNSFQLHLWKKSKKNSPFKCLCVLKPDVLWIFFFLSNGSNLW